MENFIFGLHVAIQPINLLCCFIGVTLGTIVGVLPGLGPVGAISILLPFIFSAVPPTAAIIMFAGIYYGAMYGGSTTSILINVPGEAASVMTCLDGYAMARKGRAGPALGISAMGSFFAGTIGTIGLMLVAPPLAAFALRFGPPEYFSLMILALMLLAYMSPGSMPKSIMMGVAGLLIGSIGMDLVTGIQRFTFRISTLSDGVGLVPTIMGLFGIAEVLDNCVKTNEQSIYLAHIKGLLPNWDDWKRSIGPIFRGSIIGFLLGILPGGGAVVSTFVSYGVERKISKHPEEFGKGAIEGVAGPESANNAATSGAMIPMFALGIPANALVALLLGVLLLYGLQPGPLLIKNNPEIFWGTIASMYMGNALLLVLNLPLIGVWVRILKTPPSMLFPLVLLFCIIGVYSINSNPVEIYIMLFFGVLGFLMKKYDYPAAPMVLGLILSPLLEDSFRQSLLLSHGDFRIFFTRPISATLLIAFLLILFISLFKRPTAKL